MRKAFRPQAKLAQIYRQNGIRAKVVGKGRKTYCVTFTVSYKPEHEENRFNREQSKAQLDLLTGAADSGITS